MRVSSLLIAFYLVANSAAQAETRPFTGRFLGSGRACYGTLDIREKTISWLTTFSQCKSMSYQLIERYARKAGSRMTFRLRPGAGAGGCRYSILSLTHSGSAADSGWEVTGYGSEQSYTNDKAGGYEIQSADQMPCYLIRQPGRSAAAR